MCLGTILQESKIMLSSNDSDTIVNNWCLGLKKFHLEKLYRKIIGIVKLFKNKWSGYCFCLFFYYFFGGGFCLHKYLTEWKWRYSTSLNKRSSLSVLSPHRKQTKKNSKANKLGLRTYGKLLHLTVSHLILRLYCCKGCISG